MDAYLTLDYELFMSNDTGTVEGCLISPMKALCEVLDKHSVKANIFVDAAYLLKLDEQRATNTYAVSDFECVAQNIVDLSERGHSVQLHFHPQWLYSQLINAGGWQMDFDHYKLSDCEQSKINQDILKAYNLLQSLAKNKITAFRAGGYSLMDFIRYREVFSDLGIKQDSSVRTDAFENTRFQEYDFRHIPRKGHYRFDTNICEEVETGLFTEFPISTLSIPSISYLKIKKRLKDEDKTKKWGDGKGVAVALSRSEKVKTKFRALLSKHIIPASIESPFAGYLEQVYRSVEAKGYNDFVIIGHPKGLTPWSFECFDKFVANHPEISFKLFHEL